MSNPNNDPDNPILTWIGRIFIFAFPASLIVMLGIVGVAFIGGSGVEVTASEEDESATPSAPAEVVAESESVADAPAAPAEPTPDETATVDTPAVASAGTEFEIDPAQMELGKSAYMTCAACHGADGKGLPAGPMLMAPSLVGSEVLLGDPDLSLLTILKGIKKEGMDYMGMMAPLGAALDDEKMAAVLTFTRNSWGNIARPVTVEEAAAAREKFASVDAPAGVPRADLQAIVDAHK
ncbi:MAG: c-type cytochrome [Verrucomicrobiota bacterium]